MMTYPDAVRIIAKRIDEGSNRATKAPSPVAFSAAMSLTAALAEAGYEIIDKGDKAPSSEDGMAIAEDVLDSLTAMLRSGVTFDAVHELTQELKERLDNAK